MAAYPTNIKMIDTAAGILGDNISAQSGCYNHFDRIFPHFLHQGYPDDTTEVTDYGMLPDDILSGDASVRFDAT